MKTQTPRPVRRCPDCGVGVPPGPFQAIPDTSAWTRCPDCTAAGPDGIRAAMLARMGIEHPADDPAVSEALHRVAWRAIAIETARVRAEAEKRTRAFPGESPESRERRIGQALAGLDTVGAASVAPWDHVDARAVRRAVEEGIVAAMPHPSRPCSGGPCGICGVRTSPSWPYSVHIGTGSGLEPGPRKAWPVCDTCAPVLDAAGGIPTSEAARRRWSAAVLGVDTSPPPLSVPPLMGTYAEYVGITTDPRGADGCAASWDFVSQADRDALAQAAPQHRAPEVLDRERRAAAAVARLQRMQREAAPRTALAVEVAR